MKSPKISKIISIICCIIALIATIYGLIISLGSIDRSGWSVLLAIIIAPTCLVALLIVVFDLLIALNVIKKGLIYSYISTILKIFIIILYIPTAIYSFISLIRTGMLFSLDLIIVALLIVAAVPSILNIVKLNQQRKKK